MQGVTYRVPFYSRVARFIFKPVCQGILHVLADVHIEGDGNLPRGKPYIVAFNHISLYDPPLMVIFWPEMLEVIGASDIWGRPGQKQLAYLYHVMPVHRGEVDRTVIEKALRVLEAGRPLLISPEGGRSHVPAMRPAKSGIAYLVERSRVPVVPVGVVGTTDDLLQQISRGKRPKLEMHIGKPIQLPPVEGAGDARREIRRCNADLVMAHIAGLLPESYRGYYADRAISPP